MSITEITGPADPKSPVGLIAEAIGGSAQIHELRNEQGETVHAFATASFPLRGDHWIYKQPGEGFSAPPMPLRMGEKEMLIVGIADPNWTDSPGQLGARTYTRLEMGQMIRAAGKYAIKAATMNGTEMDFDPDAVLQNLVVGFLGYWTHNGLDNEDDWANPREPWKPDNRPADPTGNPMNAQGGCGPVGSSPTPQL